MEMIPVKPERKAQLEAYAERHGKDAVTALDDVLADYLAADQQEYDDTVKAVTQALKASRRGARDRQRNFLKNCA